MFEMKEDNLYSLLLTSLASLCNSRAERGPTEDERTAGKK